MSNHLGNVLAVVSDRKIAAVRFPGSDEVKFYVADVTSHSEYYPFGMTSRSGSDGGNYRYGYQGSEKDDELKGNGNSYTTYHRMLDPRIGRWFSVDPKSGIQPWFSPYNSMNNNPISFNDPNGDIVPLLVIALFAVYMTAPIPIIDQEVQIDAYQNTGMMWVAKGAATVGGLQFMAAGGVQLTFTSLSSAATRFSIILSKTVLTAITSSTFALLNYYIVNPNAMQQTEEILLGLGGYDGPGTGPIGGVKHMSSVLWSKALNNGGSQLLEQLYNKAGRLFTATFDAAEQKVADILMDEGRSVIGLIERSKLGDVAVKTADFIVDGVLTELKTVENVVFNEKFSSKMGDLIKDAAKQGNGNVTNVIIDLSHYGDQDLYVYNFVFGPGEIRLYENVGDETFEEGILLDATTSFTFEISDLDNDEVDDLIGLNSGSVSFYKNEMELGFTGGVSLNWHTRGAVHVHSVDLDVDGDLDLISSSRNDDRVVWFQNNGDGVYTKQKEISINLNHPNMTLSADLNNDERIDLVTISHHEIVWFENLGEGGFSSGQIITDDASDGRYITLLDVEMDGDIDVVFASYNDDKIAMHENLGDGTFGAEEIITVDLNAINIVLAADLNGDEYLDLLATALSGDKVVWFENLGDGTFGDENSIATDFNTPSGLDFGDLDGDGDLDIVAVSSSDDKVVWFENIDEGGFATEQIIESGIANPYKVYTSDLNQDGRMDIIVLSYVEDVIFWQENLGGEFGPEIILAELDGPKAIDVIDIQGDGDLDFFSASQLGHVILHKNNEFEAFQVKGHIYLDENENGIKDDDENGINYFLPETTPAHIFSSTTEDGNYYVNFDGNLDENYTVFPSNLDYWYVTSDSSVYNIEINEDFIPRDSLDFGVYPSVLFDSLNADIVGGFPRCNTTINYWLNFKNLGTTTPNVIVKLELADQISFISAEIIPDSIIGQSIYWHYDSLNYFSEEQIQTTVLLPDFMSIGDTLKSYLSVAITEEEITSYLEVDSIEQVLVCAYDPNDKKVSPSGIGDFGNIPPTENELDYTIRFQNTGNDTAITIVIKDQLHSNLDWSSFSFLSSSHEAEVDLDLDGKLTFTFNDIYLPDSNINEVNSHGFVKYRIRPLPDLPLESVITNKAYIYFDLNPPILTNETINTIHLDDFTEIKETLGKVESLNIKITPNPFTEFTLIEFDFNLNDGEAILVYNTLGELVYQDDMIKGVIIF